MLGFLGNCFSWAQEIIGSSSLILKYCEKQQSDIEEMNILTLFEAVISDF